MKRAYKHILLIGLLAMAVTGVVACGEEREATPLSSPQNVYLCHNQTLEDTTEYILTWDKVKGADGYEISAFGKTFTVIKNSYDFTAYCEIGQSERFSVKAIGDGKEYADSKETKVSKKAEEITNGLIYSRQVDGTYTVSRENAEIVNGRLVLPDTYNGKEITKTVSSAEDKRETGIISARFPQHLTEIGEKTFFAASIENIVIPEGVKTIGERSFCSETLKKVVFPSTLTSIGAYAFDDCGLEEVNIPQNVMALGEYAFLMNQLKKVTFEEGSKIKELSEGIFQSNLITEIDIPDGVEKIGRGAFISCNLTEITLPESVQTIGYLAFDDNPSLTSLHIPKSLTGLEDGALCNAGFPQFTSFTVAEDNPAYKAVDGNIYSKDGTVLVQYACGKTATEFSVPDGVKKIGAYAFRNVNHLVKVTLPQGIEEIGDCAFESKGSHVSVLAEINFPDGLTTIGRCAFDRTKLTDISLPDSVKVIKQNAFGSISLKEFQVPPHIEVFGKQFGLCVDVMKIPEGMELAGKALQGTKINKLLMPKTFEASEGALFANIPLAMPLYIPDVFYEGTETEFLQLIEDGLVAEDAFSGEEESIDFINPDTNTGTNNPVYNATIYYYSEEEPPLNADGTAYDGNFWRYDENGEIVVWVKETA